MNTKTKENNSCEYTRRVKKTMYIQAEGRRKPDQRHRCLGCWCGTSLKIHILVIYILHQLHPMFVGKTFCVALFSFQLMIVFFITSSYVLLQGLNIITTHLLIQCELQKSFLTILRLGIPGLDFLHNHFSSQFSSTSLPMQIKSCYVTSYMKATMHGHYLSMLTSSSFVYSKTPSR